MAEPPEVVVMNRVAILVLVLLTSCASGPPTVREKEYVAPGSEEIDGYDLVTEMESREVQVSRCSSGAFTGMQEVAVAVPNLMANAEVAVDPDEKVAELSQALAEELTATARRFRELADRGTLDELAAELARRDLYLVDSLAEDAEERARRAEVFAREFVVVPPARVGEVLSGRNPREFTEPAVLRVLHRADVQFVLSGVVFFSESDPASLLVTLRDTRSGRRWFEYQVDEPDERALAELAARILYNILPTSETQVREVRVVREKPYRWVERQIPE